jgi:lysophospholipase L1-like esterase
MKQIHIIAFMIFLCVTNVAAQQDGYSTFYYQRASIFEKLSIDSTDIVFLGNSITNFGEWSEFFNNIHIKNRGISGDRTIGVIDRLNTILVGKPKKIFLMIGVNDLQRGASTDSVVNGIVRIAKRVTEESPYTKLFIQSILPVNDQFGKFPDHTNKGSQIIEINNRIKSYCKKQKLIFIDLYNSFKNKENEKMNPAYTNDGLHLMGEGYLLWVSIIKDFIFE